jgi:cell division protease FtsH
MDAVLTHPAADGVIEARRVSPRARSLDDLIGLDEVKAELRAQIRVWSAPHELARLGGAPRAGLLFAGPTGTGKTTAANALAAEARRPLYTFAGPDFHDAAGKDLLATVLSVTARQPAVVFVDEADDLVHARDHRREASESLVKYLLVGLDRTSREISAFFVFATNLDPERIDPALCHPGRLGRPIRFRTLDTQERLRLLEQLASRYLVAPGVLLDGIAARLERLPTASVAHAFDEAAFVAWRRGADAIGLADLHEAATRLRSGIPRARSFTAQELYAVAVHESGHAIARLVVEGRWSAVAFVAVDARADGALGEMEERPADGSVQSEREVRDALIVGLAGRAAERLVFGQADTGSSVDLANCNALALSAVRDWGFGRRGPRTADRYAEAILEARIDDDVAAMLGEAERQATFVLARSRAALVRLADLLVEHRSATAADLERWLGDVLDLGPRGVER